MSRGSFMDYLDTLEKPWKFLAPMVGNSEHAYRILARRYGADVCYTEMINSKVYNRSKSSPVDNHWFTTGSTDRPLVMQICGHEPESMLQTCLSIQDHCDAIDINFGCPQDVAKRGRYGAYLQDEWDLVHEIVSTCARGIKVPLFCKIRVFPSIEKTVEYAKVFEAAGASLLAVHGRTRDQRGENSGLASWEHIKAVKQALSIPVVANGNMIFYEDIQRCYDCTGCDGVMIAEPHLFVPTIFTPEKISALAMFREYLEIVRSDAKLFEGGAAKSHCFKMFRPLFLKLPDLRIELDKARVLEDYFQFCDTVDALLEEGTITEADLELLPYTRSTK